jgi:hypothetical protein
MTDAAAIHTLARMEARRRIGIELRNQGRRLQEFSTPALAKAYQVYFEECRDELLAVAKGQYQRIKERRGR